ncbi:hypothetical protein [Streptomyces sp. NBC_00687]|uniref:hypothetical protein n=1 Tax=Streptomyces sp. NBC_00687 TaxID=2975807 RepID=UPI00224D174F|nr:hypothetical protein [Streptomyces sp. NBC_00687]MCX4920034.1 hypothetical protein [Streptomyces sp. NBC_00687]
MIAVHEEIRAGDAPVLHAPIQLHVHTPGLRQQRARNLPHRRGEAVPDLGLYEARHPVDDPRICPRVPTGQLTLFALRRRLERSDARRIAGRAWPEETLLQELAERRAAEAGLSATWPRMVMRLIRCALAIRDAEGEALVAEEMLDQVRLPLKAAASELLAQAGLLRSRTRPPPVAWPMGSCADCECWGVTRAVCTGCRGWRRETQRYPRGLCPRCRRSELPLHTEEGLCRGCLAYVREAGQEFSTVPFTQLSFAGPLSLQLKGRTGQLGFVAHKRSGPLMRARARDRLQREADAVLGGQAVPWQLAGQLALFSVPRTRPRNRCLRALITLPLLPDGAQALLHRFCAAYPRTLLADRRSTAGAAAVMLHSLLARYGPHTPIAEREVRSLAASVAANAAAMHWVTSFLHTQNLLQTDKQFETPGQLLQDVRSLATFRAPIPLQQWRDERDEQALHLRITQLPAPMASQLSTWVRVLRGKGRCRHDPADFRRIRRYLRVAWPALTSWAADGGDLRQVTVDDVRIELARHQGNVARGMLSVLRSIFRALKQERVIFRDPTAGLQQPGGLHLPRPLSSDDLAGALDRLDGSAARLIVGLVAIHAVRAAEVARLHLADLDLVRRTLSVCRSERIHIVYLDDLSVELTADWLRERRRRWPQSSNPHLLITTHTYRHPAAPSISYCAIRAAFDQVGLLPRQVWADRILDEARHSVDPVHLVRLFGIHPASAVKYVHAAHPDKALPRIR